MNYLGEEDDLDEYMQLENQILNEDPEQLKQYARMFKSKTPDVQNFGKNDDLFGDLNALGEFTYQSPGQSSNKKKQKQTIEEIEPYQDFQENLHMPEQEESSSLNDDNNEILNTKAFGSMMPNKPSTFQPASKLASQEKEKPKKYQLKIHQQETIQEPSQSHENNSQHPSTDVTTQQPYNVVQIPNNIKSLLNGKQKKSVSQQQLKPKAEQSQQQPLQPQQQQQQQQQLQEQEQVSSQLQQLQQQIQNYKNMQNDLKKQKKDLELDYQHLLIEFNKEKEEFMKYRKQEMANLSIQKNINDRNREDRKIKQQKEKEIQKENEDLKQQIQQLKEQQKKSNVTKNNQIEGLKQNLENQIQYNNELKQKLEEQDKMIVTFKLQNKEGGEKSNAMQMQVIKLQDLLNNKELEIKSFQQQVFALNQKNEQLEAENQRLKDQKKSYNDLTSADVSIKSDVYSTIQRDIKSQIDKKLLDQMQKNKHGGDIFAKHGLTQTSTKGTNKSQLVQERSKSQGILRVRNTSNQQPSQLGNSRMDNGISAQFQQKLQEEFPEIPFLDPDAMFVQFQQDMDQFVNKAKLIDERQKKDVFEQKFDSGARFLNFSNGTSKLLMPNNVTNIKFENGDLKRVQGSLQVYYYYEVQTLFTQYPDVDGKPLKVYRFANGQTEKHYEDGRKSVYYTDLIVKYVQADGSEVVEYPQ